MDQIRPHPLRGFGSKTMLNLNGIWNLEYEKDGIIRHLNAEVPGDVLLTLMKHGIIPDPLIRNNFLECKWVGKRAWTYTRRFAGRFPENKKHILVFQGLIYQAEVYLNGHHVATHKNMHRSLKVDVSGILLDGENVLKVILQPYDRTELETPVIRLWSGWSDAIADPAYCIKRGAARRADYLTGWDWTQGLPVCGIWRDVFLESVESIQIADPFLKTRNSGEIRCSFRLTSILRQMETARCLLEIRKKGKSEILTRTETELVVGPGEIEYEIKTRLNSPELWYPSGCGSRTMYQCDIEIRLSESAVRRTVFFAFREFEIQEEAFTEKQGSFHFILNGKRIFARGANWIPPDIIPCRATEERYRHLLNLAVLGNLNYFRFWGGGFFENELFYDLCDEHGIMIWHDLMFGGEEIPEFDPEFRSECLREIRENVTRLRNHPSIVVWCGSNETDDFFSPEGSHKPPRRPEGRYYGYRLFHRDLPPLMKELVPDAVYIPSCPTPGKAAPPGTKINAWGFGTTHRNFLSQYDTDTQYDSQHEVPAFFNEAYGVSPDSERTLLRYLSEEDLSSYTNPVFSNHNIMDLQRNDEWTLFFRHLAFHHESRRFDLPLRTLFAYFTEAHCELIKRYTEFLRRNRQYAGGAAFWMFNSAYTMSGWSWIDYYGMPKAVFYAAKRAYSPILPVIAVYEDCCRISISNLSDFNGPATLETTLFRFDGSILLHSSKEFRLSPEENLPAELVMLNDLKNFIPEECFLSSVVSVNGKRTENHRFFVSPRERRIPDAEIRCEWNAGNPQICTLETDCFADTVVFPECGENGLPDDNFFDLCPGEIKTVHFLTPPTRKPEINWKNRNRSPYIVKSEKKKAGCCIWELCFFNPSKSNAILNLRVDAPNVFSDPEFATTLRPYEIRKVSIPLVPSFSPEYPSAFPITLFHNGNMHLDLLELDAPNEFKNGSFQRNNPLRIPITVPASEFTITRNDLTEYRCLIPSKTVAPGETYSFPLKIPAGALPFTASIRKEECLASFFWEESQQFMRSQLKLLPCREFKGELSIRTMRKMFPLSKEEGCGILFHPAENMTGRLFLRRRSAMLYLHVFLENVPLEQNLENEAVYRESCIELAFFDRERKHFRDYSLASTLHGDQLFLRRGSLPFSKGLRHHLDGQLAVRSLPDKVTCYFLMLDTVRAGLEQLLNNELFFLRVSVCWPGHKYQLTVPGENPLDIPVRILPE